MRGEHPNSTLKGLHGLGIKGPFCCKALITQPAFFWAGEKLSFSKYTYIEVLLEVFCLYDTVFTWLIQLPLIFILTIAELLVSPCFIIHCCQQRAANLFTVFSVNVKKQRCTKVFKKEPKYSVIWELLRTFKTVDDIYRMGSRLSYFMDAFLKPCHLFFLRHVHSLNHSLILKWQDLFYCFVVWSWIPLLAVL